MSEEIEILRSIALGIQNTSIYAYTKVVEGTQVAGIASIVTMLICGTILIMCAKYRYRNQTKEYNDIELIYIIIGTLLVIFGGLILYDAMVSVAAPEYYVIHDIMDRL